MWGNAEAPMRILQHPSLGDVMLMHAEANETDLLMLTRLVEWVNTLRQEVKQEAAGTQQVLLDVQRGVRDQMVDLRMAQQAEALSVRQDLTAQGDRLAGTLELLRAAVDQTELRLQLAQTTQQLTQSLAEHATQVDTLQARLRQLEADAQRSWWAWLWGR